MSTTLLRPTLRTESSASDVPASFVESSAVEAETRVGHLAATGFGLGGTVGAVLGALAVGIAAMTTDVVLPGSSLYVAGPLSAMLLGAGAGAANGGLAGALIGWGIPVELNADDSIASDKSLRQSVRSVLCPTCK